MPLGRTITDHGGIIGRTRYECSTCGRLHRFADAARQCCSFRCENCGNTFAYQEDALECCGEAYTCPVCGAYHNSEENALECCEEIRLEQEEHHRRVRDRYTYPREILSTEPEYLIKIPDIPGRPSRLTSIEQELSDGGNRAARLLYDMQMSQYDSIINYTADCSPGEACVKQDSSLDRNFGGEVLYSRFKLSHETHQRRLSKAIWYLRQLRNQKLVKTSSNAGVHIHISVTPTPNPRTGLMDTEKIFGPAQMAALYEIFSFCEDVLFKLASAGWKSHRGTRYTLIHPKQEKMSPGVLMKFANRDRHYSLNFARLLNAVRACTCGACVVGDWQECECGALTKGTVEWRIFNATTKPETMHAWLLLAHAITAKAFDYRLGELQPNGYMETEPERHAWILGWILNECPFLPEEREIILALAKRSPDLHVDWEALEATIELPGTTDQNGDDDEDEIVSMDQVEVLAEDVPDIRIDDQNQYIIYNDPPEDLQPVTNNPF